jgi:hypothetical protein
MTEEHIFIDTSIFLRFFVEGDVEIEKLRKYKLFTSINVIEELSYVLLKLKAGDKYGIDRHYDLLTFLREKPDVVKAEFSEIAEDIEDLLRLLSVEVLPPAPYREMWEVVNVYGLLPNDALIAATCKHYGINKIATFDADFKKAKFLDVLELNK